MRFNCSYSSTDGLYWKYQAVGSKQHKIISNSRSGFLMTYFQRGGRHTVELNNETGSCDLIITRLTVEDAGTYVCKRVYGDGL